MNLSGRHSDVAAPIVACWRTLPARNRHKISDHIRENAITGRLEPLTTTDAFKIRLLHLNRLQLVAHWLERRAAEIRMSRLQLLEEQIAQQEQTIQFLRGYNDFLIRLLSSAAPPEE